MAVALWIRLLLATFVLLALNYEVSEAVNAEGRALKAFQRRLDDPLGVLSNWNDSDTTPCNWTGVVCDNVTNFVTIINLPSKNLTGVIAPQLASLKYLERLTLNENNLVGSISVSFRNLTNLLVLNLRTNSITGSIPSDIGSLKNLQYLDLANNMLQGSIPESFSNLTGLYFFDVSYNLLTGKVPNGALSRFNINSYLGNQNLCGKASLGLASCSPPPALAPVLAPSIGPSPAPSIGPSPAPSIEPSPAPSIEPYLAPVSKHKSRLSLVQIVLLAVGLFLAFKFIIAAIAIMRWVRKDNHIEINLGAGGKIVMFQVGTSVPSSKEMLTALRQIRKRDIIGEGGYGVVYKLQVNEESIMAVKKLKTCLESERSFENELETLGTVKHRNLVKLKGFCSAPNVKLLIYEFLPGGNLHQFLHSKKEEDMVGDWAIRFKIALGVARGLAYLHHGCDPRIIHGDVSSTNILLDTDFEPYLSDFGLATLVTTNNTHVTVTVGGTFGYVAPEFAKSGKATEKVDVYSYGVILLELLSGRRAVDESIPDDYTNLAAWARSLHGESNAMEIVDKHLSDSVAGVELDLLLVIACHCISLNPKDRPQMSKVVETLEILMETGLSPPGTSVRTSQDTSGSLKADSSSPESKPDISSYVFDS